MVAIQYLGNAIEAQKVAPRESPVRAQLASILDGYFDGEQRAHSILRRVAGSQPEPHWSPLADLRAEIAERVAGPADDDDCGWDSEYARSFISGMRAVLAAEEEE